MAKLSHTRLEAKMTALGEPVMSKTRSEVPGYRSECEDTLTRAPEMSMSSLMDAPPTPMKEPASECVMRNCTERRGEMVEAG